jgi:hypothetical protein
MVAIFFSSAQEQKHEEDGKSPSEIYRFRAIRCEQRTS